MLLNKTLIFDGQNLPLKLILTIRIKTDDNEESSKFFKTEYVSEVDNDNKFALATVEIFLDKTYKN